MLRPGTVHLYEVKHRCRARWQLRLYTSAAWAAFVSIGTLADGTWYVDVVEQINRPAELVGSEGEARERARQWMDRLGSHPERRHGRWEQIPCDVTFGWRPGEREAQAGSSEHV